MTTARPAALVTGARRGIGLAIATALADKGFDLCIADMTPADEAADQLIAELESRHGGRAIYVASDIGDLASHRPLVERAATELGRIDCLVNNAGMGAVARGDVLDLLPENFDRVMAVNLRGTIFLTQAVVRWMLAHPAGEGRPRSIVHVTSVSAALASPERLDYCISKAGLAMWSKGLALRLAPEGIAVFDVRPGIIRTDMTAGVAGAYDRRIKEGLVPARRWGEGRDVAGVVAALASGDFAFATGSVVDVDGGLGIPKL
jgi:NAD(P)-dependent dehydrogenase (short-subunit alcohol dehydrogenase family)